MNINYNQTQLQNEKNLLLIVLIIGNNIDF